MKSRLAAPQALYMKPLLFGLDRTDSPFELALDFPANNSIKLSQRSEGIRNAFLSPIDYARYGGEYRIVPGICVASSAPTNSIQLILKPKLHNVERVAIDVRYTSEIILANIILLEKYRNEPAHKKLQFIPMAPDLDAMLSKCDAAVIVHDFPRPFNRENTFIVDLVEEWNDLTGLPYIHGFWVGREDDLSVIEAEALQRAKQDGVSLASQITQSVALQQNLSVEEVTRYFLSFTYDFGEQEQESISEFIHYAYYHGVLGDIPEINFFDFNTKASAQN
jgi:predicted solute-binding protein